MELSYIPYYLQFKHPFGVSSNTRRETLSLFVKLDNKMQAGYGEACLPAYLGENADGTSLFFEKAKALLKDLPDSFSTEEFMPRLDLLAPGNNAAKAAINMALNDLQGKLAAKPYYEMAGIGKSEPMFTSFTIGIDSPEKIVQKISEAAAFSILKIKAGTHDDQSLILQVRKYTDKPLYVDVNQGWTDKHEVLHRVEWMKDQGVLLIEQPMPKTMKEDMQWVTARSPLPIIADESVKRMKDLEQLDGSFSGINIKLMKCAGLDEARQMIAYCRQNHLHILLGCMAESSCGTSAMAQLMRLADYIDLDAPLLYTNDPFEGISYKNGQVFLNARPGIGIVPLALQLNFK